MSYYLLEIISGKRSGKKQLAIWIMRQAGRYLPEYLELRSRQPDFIKFCLDKELASEATLQPLRRFALDAAIIFSDILIVPYAMGVEVKFVKNHGPVLKYEDISRLGSNMGIYNKIGESIAYTKSKLPSDKPLIGFSGSPWTLAAYILEGSGSKYFTKAREFTYKNEKKFNQLLDLLTEEVIKYLAIQIDAGADLIKLFDSWAGVLTPTQFDNYVIKPTKKIVSRIKEKYPAIKIIGFPRGGNYVEYVKTGVDVIAVDQFTDIISLQKSVPERVVLQGNLDNVLLQSGGEQLELEVRKLVKGFRGKPYIFNLGHGILPETPIENLERTIQLIKELS